MRIFFCVFFMVLVICIIIMLIPEVEEAQHGNSLAITINLIFLDRDLLAQFLLNKY